MGNDKGKFPLKEGEQGNTLGEQPTTTIDRNNPPGGSTAVPPKLPAEKPKQE